MVTVRPNKNATVSAVLQNNMGVLALTVTPPDVQVTVDGQTIVGSAETTGTRTESVEDLLLVLPGLGSPNNGSRRSRTIGELRFNARTGTTAIPLEAGERVVTISDPGYQTERRELTIKPGKTKRLRLELFAAPDDQLVTNGPGEHLFGELMPWTKMYADMCRQGDYSTGSKIATCTITFPIATVMTLGFYPLVGDIVTLPYHGARTIGRRLPRREGDRP